MEARLAKLEASVGRIEALFPTLATKADIAKLATTGQLWTMIPSVVGIAAAMIAIVAE